MMDNSLDTALCGGKCNEGPHKGTVLMNHVEGLPVEESCHCDAKHNVRSTACVTGLIVFFEVDAGTLLLLQELREAGETPESSDNWPTGICPLCQSPHPLEPLPGVTIEAIVSASDSEQASEAEDGEGRVVDERSACT